MPTNNLAKTYHSQIHHENTVTFELLGDLDSARAALGNPDGFVYRWNSYGAFGIIEVRGKDATADPQTLRRVLQLLLKKTAALEQAKCRVVSVHYSFFSSWTHRSILLSAEEIDALAQLDIPFTFSANVFRPHNYPVDSPQNFTGLSYEVSVSLDIRVPDAHIAVFDQVHGQDYTKPDEDPALLEAEEHVKRRKDETTTITPVTFLSDFVTKIAPQMESINQLSLPDENSLTCSCWSQFHGEFAQITFPSGFFPTLKQIGLENFNINFTLDSYYLPVETSESDLWSELE